MTRAMLRNARQLAGELLNAAATALQPEPTPEPRRHERVAGGCWCGRDHNRGDAIPGTSQPRYPSVLLIALSREDANAWLDDAHVDPEATVRVAQVDLSGPRLAGAIRGRSFDTWHATDAAKAHPSYPAALAAVLPTVTTAREV